MKLKPDAPEAVVPAVDLGIRSAPPRRIVVSDSSLAVEAMIDPEGVMWGTAAIEVVVVDRRTMSVAALDLSAAPNLLPLPHCWHLMVESGVPFEELATERLTTDDEDEVMESDVEPGLNTDIAISLRDGLTARSLLDPLAPLTVDGAKIERFGCGAKIPQRWPLLDDGVLMVGVGDGVTGRNAVLNTNPMTIDIKANLEKRFE